MSPPIVAKFLLVFFSFSEESKVISSTLIPFAKSFCNLRISSFSFFNRAMSLSIASTLPCTTETMPTWNSCASPVRLKSVSSCCSLVNLETICSRLAYNSVKRASFSISFLAYSTILSCAALALAEDTIALVKFLY